MRKIGQFLPAIGLAAVTLAGAQPSPPGAGAAVIAAAREALGGENKLAAVKTVVATGRTRQVRGDNLVPIEFEIDIELPDKYVRKDEIPAQESGPTISGFRGDELLQFPVPSPPPARAGGPPPPTAEQLAAAGRMRLNTVKQDFARLMLGMFTGSSPALPLTFTYAGKAEAPQGKADVLDVKGPAGPGALAARLFVNADTHLPIMLTWTAPTPPSRGGMPPQGPPPGPPAASAQQPPPESRLYFGDYREVSGLQLPFRLRRALGPDTVEETTFDGYKINAKIDPKKFEVRR
ncbi:MAG TPA: hypothetical protein VHT95_04525 [Vicinamibacterales bacterium]|jgi:hypothetical protein|nr:hypothetical protein [Vicinamibacterales bacterium]